MDGVCFDMDGVLVDSEDYWMAIERERVLPEALPDEDVGVEELTGVFYRELYDRLAADYDLAVDREAFEAIYESAADEIYGEKVALTPGVPDLLATLRDRGVSVAMVTSSPPAWHDRVLERFDLADAFDAVVSAAELSGPGKPDPGIYERAARELGVDPATCLAVEDSVQGTRAARRAGMTVIGFGVGEAGADLGEADVVAATPEALREAVLERV